VVPISSNDDARSTLVQIGSILPTSVLMLPPGSR
jgi:hypothetical protein